MSASRVARRVAGPVAREQVLAGTLRDHDDGVSAPLHPLPQARQEARSAIQAEGDLRDEDEIDVVAGQRRVTGDESGMPAHQLDQADAVRGRAGQADRKSTRLNSSHLVISYAVFCLKKK